MRVIQISPPAALFPFVVFRLAQPVKGPPANAFDVLKQNQAKQQAAQSEALFAQVHRPVRSSGVRGDHVVYNAVQFCERGWLLW